jgi:hypothetical protein
LAGEGNGAVDEAEDEDVSEEELAAQLHVDPSEIAVLVDKDVTPGAEPATGPQASARPPESGPKRDNGDRRRGGRGRSRPGRGNGVQRWRDAGGKQPEPPAGG